MVEWMLANIICNEFEKVVGKFQYKTRKAMHIGFGISTGNTTDQYRVYHMYLYGPCNYVHVVTQIETIDEAGERHVQPMRHLCYHDSCWRDSVQRFVVDNRRELNTFRSFDHMFDWYDVLTLSEDEADYLGLLDNSRHVSFCGTDHEKARIAELIEVNPFDKRGCWKPRGEGFDG